MEARIPLGMVPARDVPVIHSQTRLRLETSSIFFPGAPKSDVSYKVRMATSDSKMKHGTP
eukprot:8601863-Pyramimonas_sp.AAC.1